MIIYIYIIYKICKINPNFLFHRIKKIKKQKKNPITDNVKIKGNSTISIIIFVGIVPLIEKMSY